MRWRPFRAQWADFKMGIWIELGVFLLVFVFAAWQFHDLKREKARRLAREREQASRQPSNEAQS